MGGLCAPNQVEDLAITNEEIEAVKMKNAYNINNSNWNCDYNQQMNINTEMSQTKYESGLMNQFANTLNSVSNNDPYYQAINEDLAKLNQNAIKNIENEIETSVNKVAKTIASQIIPDNNFNNQFQNQSLKPNQLSANYNTSSYQHQTIYNNIQNNQGKTNNMAIPGVHYSFQDLQRISLNKGRQELGASISDHQMMEKLRTSMKEVKEMHRRSLMV